MRGFLRTALAAPGESLRRAAVQATGACHTRWGTTGNVLRSA